jgi:periplasmic protein TonB
MIPRRAGTTPGNPRGVRPVYPDLARKARIEGSVVSRRSSAGRGKCRIEAIISRTGQVQEARVLRGVPLLDEAALEAVRQRGDAPTLLNEQPIAVVMTVTISFKLR